MLFSPNLDLISDYIPAFYSHTGRPTRHQAQILRSLILFTLLFNRTKAKTSLTLWGSAALQRSISLALLIDYPSLGDLPPSWLLL